LTYEKFYSPPIWNKSGRTAIPSIPLASCLTEIPLLALVVVGTVELVVLVETGATVGRLVGGAVAVLLLVLVTVVLVLIIVFDVAVVEKVIEVVDRLLVVETALVVVALLLVAVGLLVVNNPLDEDVL
jgi:hypothetical protein